MVTAARAPDVNAWMPDPPACTPIGRPDCAHAPEKAWLAGLGSAAVHLSRAMTALCFLLDTTRYGARSCAGRGRLLQGEPLPTGVDTQRSTCENAKQRGCEEDLEP